MKQKIVIKLWMDSEKARLKAMKIAADAHGVTSVAIEIEKSHLVVTGVGVDAACLMSALRKKFSHAIIVSVAEEKKKEDEKKPLCCVQYPGCSVVYEEATSLYHPVRQAIHNNFSLVTTVKSS